MRTVTNLLPVLSILAVHAYGGALVLRVSNPAAALDSQARHALVIASTTACRSPEKTSVTAFAEGIQDGVRRSLPLKVFRLSEPGSFAVSGPLPGTGYWLIRVTATNPDYKDY